MDTFIRKITKVLFIELGVILLTLLEPWISYPLLFLVDAPSSGLGTIGAMIEIYLIVVTAIVIGSAIIAAMWIKDTKMAKFIYSLLTAFVSILIITLISNRA